MKCRLDPPPQLSRNSRLGKIESYTRSCVFLIAPLAAESPRKNPFPYDALASGRSVYAYVKGNPLSLLDPLGLLVSIIGSNPTETAQLTAAYNLLSNTLTGAVWTSALENSPNLYLITHDPTNTYGDSYFNPYNNVISVDPNFHPTLDVAGSCSKQAASTAIDLAHEIAHAVTGAYDEGPNQMNNVNNENLIRMQLGLPARTAYPPSAPYAYGRFQ